MPYTPDLSYRNDTICNISEEPCHVGYFRGLYSLVETLDNYTEELHQKSRLVYIMN